MAGPARESPALPPTDEILGLLETGQLELVGRLIDASNATFVVRVVVAGDERQAVYKPIRGERPLSDFPPRTLALREQAAFLLSEAAGWAIVPPTVLRDGPLGRGMVQEWIDVDARVDVFEMLRTPDARLRRVAVFDALANNADRKGGHLLPVAGGHVYGVDHGVCFAALPKLRTVLWGWRGESFTADELAALERVADALGDTLDAELGRLLSHVEVNATRRRVERLLSTRHFPIPDPRRPALPWPPF